MYSASWTRYLCFLTLLVAICGAVGDSIDGSDSDVGEVGVLDDNLLEKRGPLFRYGRAAIFRYGKRGRAFRFGKRPAVFRYGKRSDDEVESAAPMENDKRLFRWGKRDDEEINSEKRLFKWGKRSDDYDDVEDEDFENAQEKRVFRFGKRNNGDVQRRVFRFGKRADVYGLQYPRDTRVPNQPHTPFRFGEK